mmetsp:Transcript_10078/g.11468  ORF Transcript_10078/g.11468 Transcript_10078/m.11468 type:complete len:196 (-) Transcript_10078:181-768(-)|eukprot:CAMPEP_0205824960 /NCGR_PEP_ID=MMETSP0206-20130828/23338_1 /ASSEMBLY_ACC=CAM_ASM_000279 /TAXON_ID=36767 /ORGANISM="Euplotes focardii, Strain TN1" /LENGTH=195 /DNA_ID=CAMNT_0053123561 /DNA_START=42 /DNA_END=629 /DNA_ORIENTATION=+
MDVEAKDEEAIVTPGQQLGETSTHAAGQGVYELNGCIFSSVVGVREIKQPKEGAKAVISVLQEKSPSVVPETGDIVTGRVTRVNSRLASVKIVTVGSHLVREPFTGTIRKHDVRQFDVDAVEIYKSFRPGDVVRAQVISLGDTRSYYLTTAKNEFGVILAQSATGHTLVPISWQQMQDERGLTEYRKVAQVDPAK